MNEYSIPKATRGRLPLYLQYLKSLPAVKGATISATAIANGLSLGDVQVRKDLATVSGAGRPKIGYEREIDEWFSLAQESSAERFLITEALRNTV